MRSSECVRLEVPLHARIRLLRGEYQHFERDPNALDAQLDCLSALHGRQKIAQWKALARDDNWDGVVEQLLVEHYDPAYLKSIDRNFEHAASADVVRIESDAIEDYRAAARALRRPKLRPTCPRLISPRPTLYRRFFSGRLFVRFALQVCAQDLDVMPRFQTFRVR